MNRTFVDAVGAGLLAIILSTTAQAALVDRGGGLIYDADLNITWLRDANLAASNTFGVSGIGSDGTMSWSTAQSWIGAMNANNYLGFHDWRLPITGPVNGVAMNYNSSYIGTTDNGYNVSAPGTLYAGSKGSEMAYLFYYELANKGYCDPVASTVSSCAGSLIGTGLTNSGPFSNIQSGSYIDPDWGLVFSGFYWSGTEYAPATSAAMHFSFGSGSQGATDKAATYYAWAVRSGDVATVPTPAAFWLLGSGLIGLLGATRKRKH